MDRSHPFIEVSIEGRTVNDAFYSRLVSATIHDRAGQQSDTLDLVFDDSGNEIQIPELGAKIDVLFGFRGTGTYKMGLFVYEKARYRFGDAGEFLTLSGKSADMRADIKEPLSEHFDDQTIGQIVEALAKRHGYKAKVSPEFANIHVEYTARSDQSTFDFLTRLADRYGALFSIKNDTFLFLERGTLPPITIFKSDCSSGSFMIDPRPRYGKAAACWYDRSKNATTYEEEETGMDGPTRRLRTVHSSRAEAKRAAKAEGRRLKRSSRHGTITLAGSPEILADAPLNLSGFRHEVDGVWAAKDVAHIYATTYTTQIQLEAPEKQRS
ncbi:phage late control D family protein [Brucella anthropi]|uniref:phage late control D family protein n=1 Tax=Brucella anthropi TaxID=529 RepID=UPI00235EDFE8|nr:contractile injection system protein, VgrG/Pvc8 family [Brucella anthropi]